MPKKKTHEQFLLEMKLKHPNITVIGVYINTNEPIECHCMIHNHYWNPRPKHLLSGHGCPLCGIKTNSKNRTKTHENFIEEFKNKFPDSNIEILGEYTGVNNYIQCRCKIDGHIWDSTAHNLLHGRNCPQCSYNNFCGENNPRWNPNITDEERATGRNYPEYKEWRDSVFKRDNYTCQITGKTGRLVAHHIFSYDNNYDRRLDIENGVTILEEIHYKFHSIYGYGNNTLEQWEDFKNSFKE